MVANAKLSLYEESRLKRMEENKTRLEALNLHTLSQSLKNSPSPKPSPMKHMKPRTPEKKMVMVRRSSRVANIPAPVYVEVDVRQVARVGIPRRVSKARDYSNAVYVSDELREETVEKAERLQSGLELKFPSFVRPMLPSHVSGGFWLGLPVYFCKENLPKQDAVMTLIDEAGEEYPTIYLQRKSGLSGGWKGFAVAHELAYGDALVFQLVRATAFKVYIIRVANSEPGSD